LQITGKISLKLDSNLSLLLEYGGKTDCIFERYQLLTVIVVYTNK